MSGWTIPLQRLTEKAKGDLATVVRKATLDAFTRVVLKSPVDTGRFRANWNFSVGAPDYGVTPSTNQARGQTEAAKALSVQVGTIAYLSNGLPYARRLENGWSKQAPAGMVRTTVAEFNAIVQRAKP